MTQLQMPRQRLLTVASLIAVVLVAPATLFFAALAGTRLQPLEHEPAHTLGRILDAFALLPIPAFAVMLLALPAVALVVSALVLRTAWTSDSRVRADVAVFLNATRRLLLYPAFVVSALAFLLAIGVLGAVIAHLIAD